MKVMLIILAFWVVLVAGIFVFGFWKGPACSVEVINAAEEANDTETLPWYKKHPHLYPERNISSLVLLHVIVRHGDRTNLQECQYPQDPYLNETYAPFGLGAMTNAGKRRMYEVGRALRYDYDGFLHDYNVEDLDAISSELGRTKASLELILAGLYPPTENFVWMKGMNWQPIPFRSLMGKDNLLGNPRRNCANWDKYFAESMDKFRDTMTNYSDYFDRLEKLTGWPHNLLSVNLIYNSIITNLDWGYELHDKLKAFWPEPTKTLNNIFWKAWSETQDIRQAGAGLLLEKILEDTTSKVMRLNTHKLHMYSCHDFNIVSFLRILGQEIYDNPPFGAYVIVELHQDESGEFYLKFFYRASLDEMQIELIIPDCHWLPSDETNDASRCSFDDFLGSRLLYFPPPDYC